MKRYFAWTVLAMAASFCMTTNVFAADAPQKPAPAVKVEVRSWRAFEKLVASHKGKVVIADIWTTTCATCIEEYPKFLALRKRFPADKIVLISINCDFDGIKDKPPSFYRPDVMKFLKKQNSTIDNVMLNVAFLDFLNQIDLSSTPAILVYGADGKLSKRFDNDDAEEIDDEFSIKDVQGYVEKLLRK